MICVCEDDLCNSEKYSSEAPPVTPGSGLFCYSSDHHRYCNIKPQVCLKKDNYKYWRIFRDENGEWVSDREVAEDTEECEKNEAFCMEQTNDQ